MTTCKKIISRLEKNCLNIATNLQKKEKLLYLIKQIWPAMKKLKKKWIFLTKKSEKKFIPYLR